MATIAAVFGVQSYLDQAMTKLYEADYEPDDLAVLRMEQNDRLATDRPSDMQDVSAGAPNVTVPQVGATGANPFASAFAAGKLESFDLDDDQYAHYEQIARDQDSVVVLVRTKTDEDVRRTRDILRDAGATRVDTID
jgi:hypothetical protein